MQVVAERHLFKRAGVLYKVVSRRVSVSYSLNTELRYDNRASRSHESQGSSRRVFVFSLADDDNLNVSAVTAGGPNPEEGSPLSWPLPRALFFSLYTVSHLSNSMTINIYCARLFDRRWRNIESVSSLY